MGKTYYIAHSVELNLGQRCYAFSKSQYYSIMGPSLMPGYIQLYETPEQAAEAAGQWRYTQKAMAILDKRPTSRYTTMAGMRLQKVQADGPVNEKLRTNNIVVLQELDLEKAMVDAVGKHPSLLQDHFKDFITPEMIDKAITCNGEHGYGLYCVPEKYRTPECCMKAVKMDCRAVVFVPQHCWVQGIANRAFEQKHDIFQCISPEYRSAEMCREYVREDPRNIRFVPTKNCTYEMCWSAVNYDPAMLKFVPREQKTHDLCLMAVKKDPKTYTLVPPEQCTRQIYEMAEKHISNMPTYNQWRSMQADRYPIPPNIAARFTSHDDQTIAMAPQSLQQQRARSYVRALNKTTPVHTRNHPEYAQEFRRPLDSDLAENRISGPRHAAQTQLKSRIAPQASRENTGRPLVTDLKDKIHQARDTVQRNVARDPQMQQNKDYVLRIRISDGDQFGR